MDSPAPGAPQTKTKAWVGTVIASVGSGLTAILAQFTGYKIEITDAQTDAIAQGVSSGDWLTSVLVIGGIVLTAVATKFGVDLVPNKPL